MGDDEEDGNALEPFPQRDSRNVGYGVARTAADAITSFSGIPGLSFATGAAMDKFIGVPLQKRRDEWFAKLGEKFIALEQQMGDFDPAQLAENEDFVSAVYEATDAAMRTGREEKREMLSNACINIAAGFKLDDILRGSFFGYIERFSAVHVRILSLLHNPSASMEMTATATRMSVGSLRAALEAALPGLDGDALERAVADLSQERLIAIGSLNGMVTGGSFLDKRSTSTGDAFLAFVSKPAL